MGFMFPMATPAPAGGRKLTSSTYWNVFGKPNSSVVHSGALGAAKHNK